tara:strand:- start:86 stop:562 length:477 start_codon:yes stop_codon:yes gene_type:complete
MYKILIFLMFSSVYADVPAENEKNNFKNEPIKITQALSVNLPAKIYSINVNEYGLVHKGTKIQNPSLKNLKIYKTPSKKDKYIIKIFDENEKVISMMGLGSPFYMHLQHRGYEDSDIFMAKISRNFEIPIPLNTNAAYISLNSQDEFGIKEVQKISLN